MNMISKTLPTPFKFLAQFKIFKSDFFQ